MSWNVNRVNLSPGESFLPGMQKTFTFEVVVPEIDGVFVFQWQMRQEGEEWFGQKTEAKQLLIGDPGSYFDAYDEIAGWKSSAALSLNSSVQQQGTACLEFSASSTDEFKKVG